MIGTKQADKAVLYSDEAIKLDPNNYKAYEIKAEALNILQKYTEALATSEQCITLKREDYNCWIHKGMAEYNLNKCLDLSVTDYHVSLMQNISEKDKDWADTFFKAGLEKCKS